MGSVLRDLIVIFQCAGMVHVTTLAEYIELAWPFNGMKLLGILDGAMDHNVDAAGSCSGTTLVTLSLRAP